MTVNLWDLAKGALGKEILGQLSNAIGESEPKTKSALEIFGPAILGGLMKKASTPDGAKATFNELNNFDTSILSNVGSLLTGGKQQSLIEMGLKILPMLFGSNHDSLLGSLAKAAGIGQGSSKSLLSMLTPLLMGFVAKQIKAGGLDLKGFTDLLLGQRRFLAGKLPANLSHDLGIAKLLDQGAEAGRAVAGAAKQASHAAAETAGSGMGFLKALVPLALLAVAAWLGWKFILSQPAPQVIPPTPEQAAMVSGGTTTGTGQAQQATVNAVTEAVDTAVEEAAAATTDAATQIADAIVDKAKELPDLPEFNLDAMTSQLNSSFGDLTQVIAGITDEASARAALPKIDEVQTSFRGLGWDQMPAANKTLLVGVLKPLVEKLKEAVAACYKIPGVQGVVEPVVGPLLKTLEGMTGTA